MGREITLDELKSLQVEMLKCIHNFCISNNIQYSLAYGTLIGAIRHKGYIPWDDDIDIMMGANDYKKFITTFNGAYPNLKVDAPEIDLNYYAPYANVYDIRTLLDEGCGSHRGKEMGYKIDVFPMDKQPLGKLFKKRQMALYRMWRIYRNNYHIYTGSSIVDRLVNVVFWIYAKIGGYENVQKQILRLRDSANKQEATSLTNLVFPIYKNVEAPIDAFEKIIEVNFEGEKFNAIASYDSYLRSIYGDYMQLPPKEKRVAHHNFKVYWK